MSCVETKHFMRVLSVAFTLALASTGCSGLSKPFPERSLHAISLGQPPEKVASSGKHVVRINPVRVSRPYDGALFVYKMGDSKFTTDYYSGFVAPPSDILTGELYAWLSSSGLFASAVSGSNSAEYDMSLATEVTSLYGDYSQGKSGQAMIEAKFFLMDASGGGARIVFQKTYREVEPLSADGPDALVKGWESAYRRMLTSLMVDLQGGVALSGTTASK